MPAVVNLGFAAPLSGPQAIVGRPMRDVVALGVADARARGWPLSLLSFDDRADEAAAAEVARKMALDASLVAVVGHKNSGPSMSAAPIYHGARLAQVSQCSTDSALSRGGWDTFFRLCADNERQATVAADFVAAELKPLRPVAVHDGTGYGQPLVKAFTRRMAELAAATEAVFQMSVGQEDFTELAAAIESTGADLVYIGATEVEGGKLTAALRRRGLRAQVVSAEGGPFSPFASIAGAAAEGSIHTYAGANPFATQDSRALAERCEREIGQAPSFLVECYEAVMVVLSALERGAKSREEVRQAVAHTDIPGLVGHLSFEQTGERAAAPVSLWRVESGSPVPLATVRTS